MKHSLILVYLIILLARPGLQTRKHILKSKYHIKKETFEYSASLQDMVPNMWIHILPKPIKTAFELTYENNIKIIAIYQNIDTIVQFANCQTIDRKQ